EVHLLWVLHHHFSGKGYIIYSWDESSHGREIQKKFDYVRVMGLPRARNSEKLNLGPSARLPRARNSEKLNFGPSVRLPRVRKSKKLNFVPSIFTTFRSANFILD